MAWPDRLREAALTPPSGTRLTFQFENVSRQVTKKTAGFTFPDADGTFVQQNGKSGRRYPLRIFLSGADHDTASDVFLAALEESGTFRLEHPLYGEVDVVPFGDINQRDDLKTAANQSIFEVTFWATIGTAYPTSQGDPASAVLVAVEEYNVAEADALDEELDLSTASKRSAFENAYLTAKDVTTSGLQAIADTQDDVAKQFAAISDSIDGSIQLLIADPITLALQTQQLIQAPGRAVTSIQAQLDAYGNLIDGLAVNIALPGQGNEFSTRDLFASTYVTGSILSAVNHQFVTKPDAISAAEALLDQFDQVVVWRDLNFEALGEPDTGGAYQQLQEAVAIAAGFLVQISFTLKQERRITLDRARTFIDLAAELYGETDSTFDFFIQSNDLSGDEIQELPAGREIKYYV